MQLLRVVGFTYGNMVLLSSTIGTGIFVSPKEVLKYCSMNIPIFLSMWAVGGLLSLMNALCLAELATTFPVSGVSYYFLKQSLGYTAAFLSIWIRLFSHILGISAQSLLIATYLIQPFYSGCLAPELPKKCLALSFLWLFGILNAQGIKTVIQFQAIGNLMKMAVLCLISVTGIVLLVTGDKENVTRFENGLDAELPDVSQIVEAFLQVYYSYVGSSLLINIAGVSSQLCTTAPMASRLFSMMDSHPSGTVFGPKYGDEPMFETLRFGNIPLTGMDITDHRTYNATFVELGEIKNPTNTIPKSLISGLSIVMVFYLLTNISYVAVLTPQEIISSDSVAVTWMYRVFPFIQWATSLGISAAMMNCLSSGLLSGSRIIYAASQDGQLPFIYSMLNDHHNPVVGAILIIILSSIAIIISKLIYLMKYVGLGAWCINFLNMIGLLKMRYQKPNLPRPYKVWLPFVFGTIVLSVFIIFIPVILSPNIEHVYQVVFLFCGLLCYWLQAHFNRHAVCFDTITCYWQLFFNVSPSEDGDNLIPSLNPD